MKKGDIYVEFGKRIALLRGAMSLSQEDAAKALGMAQSTYAGYESAIRKVPMDVIVAMASFYDVSPNYLIKGEDNSFNKDITLSQAAQRIARLYDVATDHAKSIVEVTLEPFDKTKKGVNAANNDEKGTLAG